MTPDIDKPILQVRVSWPGASPKDVEREIVLRLERELTGLPGVQSVESDSRRGRARVTLTYGVGQNMDAALVNYLVSWLEYLDFQTMQSHQRLGHPTPKTPQLPGWLWSQRMTWISILIPSVSL